MSFSFGLACKNIKRRPVRAALMCIIVLFLSFTAYMGGYLIISLQNGLEGYRARLGADIVVVPSSSQGHGTVDNVLLQGITGNYYIPQDSLKKLDSIEGIEKSTSQFYLTSAKASCCSARVQIIGFDPETDFTILPWISSSTSPEMAEGDIIIGSDIAYPADGSLRFYGESYRVAAQLEKTGTGLDNAVFTMRDTISKMARSASAGVERESLRGVDLVKAASCVLIKVRDGYDISAVADDINIHVPKVRAVPSVSMIGSVADGLGNVSVFISIITAGIWLIAVVIIIAVFALMMNERKKEFAVLRILGTSSRRICLFSLTEGITIGAAGGIAGLVLGMLTVFPFNHYIENSLDVPYLMPSVLAVILYGLAGVLVTTIFGSVSSFLSTLSLAHAETYYTMRAGE